MSENENNPNDLVSPEPVPTENTFSAPESTPIADKPPLHLLEVVLNIGLMLLPFVFVGVVYTIFAGTNHFTDERNMQNIFREATYIGFVAVGMTAVMLMGQRDFSVIGTVALAAYLFAKGIEDSSGSGGMVLAIIMVGAIGVLQGLFIGALKLPSAIATLGVGIFASMIVFSELDGRVLPLLNDPPAILTDMSGSYPVMFIVLLVILFILEGLHIGIRFTAGSITIPAWILTLVGIFAAYTLAGLMSATGGVLLAARLRSVQPNLGGTSLLLIALTAVLMGGTSPFGKRGWFTGTLVAVVGLAMLRNGLILDAAPVFKNDMYVSGLLIGWVILHGVVKLIIDFTRPKIETPSPSAL